MSHYNRRSSIDKFNNRPPFDIKKMDDATSTENKEQGVPLCNNCEKAHMNTAAKSYISVARYLEQFGDKYQIYKCNKNKKIIPKIIESFQKVTPKKNTKKAKLKKKSESLETLFRNNKQISGKILPNHKIMKDLLKNFDGENAMEKAVSYEQIDMIPSKDTSTYPSDNHRTLRVDKGTSTTGLQWPIIRSDTEGSRIMSDRSKCNEVNNNSDRKLNSKSPQKKELRVYNSCKFVNHVQLKNNIHRKKSSDSSDLEYFPSKENPLKKSDPVSKIPLQMFKMTNNLKMAMQKEFPNYKCNSNPGNIKKENTYVLYTDKSEETRKKQKSFVQLQVEKFNKRNNCRNVQYRGKSLKMTDAQSKRKNTSKRYMALMNSVRDTLPKMDETLVSDSVNGKLF